MFARTEIIGRLGGDPQTRYTGGGAAVTNFSVATEENWKDSSGEKKTRTTWYKIVAWKKLAEICQQFLHKGDMVFLSGRMQEREWEDKSGAKHTAWELVADTMKMLSAKHSGASAAPETAERVADEDIPF